MCIRISIMKKLFQVLLVIVFTSSAAWSQQGGRSMERIHAAKMAYITDRLHLKVDQAQDFVPLYNEFDGELRGIRQSFHRKYNAGNPKPENDAAARKYIDDNLDYQQQVLDLKRKYKDRFLKVLTPDQLANLYQAEREFRQMLMQKLNHQHGGGGGRMNNRGNGF